MKRPNMDAYDQLPLGVRQAVGAALAPWSVEMILGWDRAGWSEKRIKSELARLDREQHRGAMMAGVVPRAEGFKVEASAKRLRARRG